MTSKESREHIKMLNGALDSIANLHHKWIAEEAQTLVDKSPNLSRMWVRMGEIGFADSKNRALHHNYTPRGAKPLVAYILRYTDVFGTPTFVVRKKK